MIPVGLEAQGWERSSLGLWFKKRFLQKIKKKKKGHSWEPELICWEK